MHLNVTEIAAAAGGWSGYANMLTMQYALRQETSSSS